MYKNKFNIGNRHLYKVNHQRARTMRKNPTEAEKVVWEIVRANRLGYKFRRQQTIGEYIVDFFCLEKKLVIEIDGGYYNTLDQKEVDCKRREWLERNGYRVLRFPNHEVLENVDEVREKMVICLEMMGG